MARNQEKAQTMLAKWLRYKEESVKGPKQRRPYLAELCDDLHEAEKWRGTIIRDVSRNVAEIQNASLGEHRIRDINDRINKLFREKGHWERRIKELGGKDYRRTHRGYAYFGAARDLPGVRDLLNEREHTQSTQRQQQTQTDRVTDKAKKSRADMYQHINADYYGFGDDDDNELFWREKKMEQKLRRAKIEQWQAHNQGATHNNVSLTEQHKQRLMARRKDECDGNEEEAEARQKRKKRMRLTKISDYVPSQSEIDAVILEKRKQLLLQKYVANEGDTEHGRSLAKSIQIQQQIEKLNENENVDHNDNHNQDQEKKT
mmetsp:Transcript_57183/g.95008  ORF Transcript_57183/g.95008 Transcript_57183/m.95008 type:complete len:317 (-) Transcript_57183:139-1089(-)